MLLLYYYNIINPVYTTTTMMKVGGNRAQETVARLSTRDLGTAHSNRESLWVKISRDVDSGSNVHGIKRKNRRQLPEDEKRSNTTLRTSDWHLGYTERSKISSTAIHLGSFSISNFFAYAY